MKEKYIYPCVIYEEDRIFYNKLFNLILETKQDELIKKGVF